MITVMGATGNTGMKIARGLLDAGQQVRAIGRSRSKLAVLEDAGAEVLAGDSSDAIFLTHAFRGADAVYTLLPTDRMAEDYPGRQRHEGEAIASAIRAGGVRHVVALSSLGAELSVGTGLIMGLHAQEERLKMLEETNVLFLRPVSFFENFYDTFETIRHQGIIADAVLPDLAIPMVATRDVADIAVKALVASDWTGTAVRELIGPRDISYREATRILGEHIGKPDLDYVQLSYAGMVEALAAAGLSRSFAIQYVGMTRSFNDGLVGPRHGRTPMNTTPTRFEDFAAELASAYDTMYGHTV